MSKIITFSLLLGSIIGTAFSQNIGIGTNTPVNKLEVISAATTSTNATIYVTNTGAAGSAIAGTSNGAGNYGLRGLSTAGKGVQGYTNAGRAIMGVATGGTAVYAQSNGGYGLIASGKIRFSGGNTTPSDGAVLTSDANGNATWKRSKLAFYAYSTANAISESDFVKVEFSNEGFDTQNNFVNYTGSVTSGSSVFTAPVAGVYHFSAAILFEKSGVSQNSKDILKGTIALAINGAITAANEASSITHLNSSGGFSCYVYVNTDADLHLNANDRVWVVAINEQNGLNVAVPLNSSSYNGRFNGELIFAD